MAVTVAGASLTSCGGSGSSTGNLSADVGKDLGSYEILDLNTGSLQSADSIPDLATNPAYRTSKMLFAAVPAGSSVSGQAPNTFGAQVDEVQQTISVSRYYIGVFEVTQGQWTLIAGASNAPWTSAASLSVASAAGVDPSRPAYGLSRDAVITGLQDRPGLPLSLPSGAQWEYACRGGTSTIFYWGNLTANPGATTGIYAVTNETAQGALGPQVVGSHSPNAFGLYDMLGNIWQWDGDGNGEIRGGSWRDSLAMARCANKIALDHAVAHVLVGVRLVLTPSEHGTTTDHLLQAGDGPAP